MQKTSRRLISVFVLMALLVSITPVIAQAAQNTQPGKDRAVFIHYKNGTVKPASPGKGGLAAKDYVFLAKGAKWKTLPVNYVIDPDNANGLSDVFITNAVSMAAEEWDRYTGTELFGSYTIDRNATWDDQMQDGRNEILFGSYPDQKVIAITVVWGWFSGPAQTRQITEMDVLFNNYYTWGDATVDPSKMDLQNIATHEIGHGAGLGDLYYTTSVDETMYGYSHEGETKKRDLFTGDIAGIRALYGN